MKKHVPVMVNEVISFLAPRKNKNYIDCTVGSGGHAQKILTLIRSDGKLLCLDQNNESLNEAEKNLKKYYKQCIFVHDNFSNLGQVVRSTHFSRIFGILYDLGLASWQIEESGLGISFQKDEPLDMRLQNQKYNDITAEEIINKYSPKKIADILYQYGDVRNSWGIAKRIEIARRGKPIRTTFELVRAIGFKPNLQNKLKKSNPKPRWVRGCPVPNVVQGKILAPIFQGLRIYVNDELNNLKKTLEQAIDLIEPGGRIVVISYHSGEDRITKNIFRTNKNKIKILTKKPIIPTQIEILQNPRARSAKLRAVEKIK